MSRMTRSTNRLMLLCFLMAAVVSGVAAVGARSRGVAPVASAGQNARALPFPEAELFFELNDTDGDLGIHSSIDGGPWTNLEIEGPGDRTWLEIVSRGSLRRQGMTQLFFESAEPSFDELDPADFFRRFPEGRYEISGVTQNGGELESITVLSHVLPARPANIRLSGVLAPESCDATPLPIVATPVLMTGIADAPNDTEAGYSGTAVVMNFVLPVMVSVTPLGVRCRRLIRRSCHETVRLMGSSSRQPDNTSGTAEPKEPEECAILLDSDGGQPPAVARAKSRIELNQPRFSRNVIA